MRREGATLATVRLARCAMVILKECAILFALWVHSPGKRAIFAGLRWVFWGCWSVYNRGRCIFYAILPHTPETLAALVNLRVFGFDAHSSDTPFLAFAKMVSAI